MRRLLLSQWLLERQRKEQFGELVQIDGSIHDWFEDGTHKCLLNMVDDATGKTLSKLAEGETCRVVFECLMAWIKKYGIPLALYVDLKSVYVSPKAGGLSQLQKVCERLGIRIIKARSPQAKGRVERNHAVYQDRFVKHRNLMNIKTIDAANKALDEYFINELNKKFEVSPANEKSAHLLLNGIDLKKAICWTYQRTLSNDWTFCFNSCVCQIHKRYGDKIKPRAKLEIRKHLDGQISAWYDNQELEFSKTCKSEKFRRLEKQ